MWSSGSLTLLRLPDEKRLGNSVCTSRADHLDLVYGKPLTAFFVAGIDPLGYCALRLVGLASLQSKPLQFGQAILVHWRPMHNHTAECASINVDRLWVFKNGLDRGWHNPHTACCS